jgi:hypothetical protein
MKLLTALLIALPIVCYGGEPVKLRYNWVEGKWNYAPKSAKLQLNWVENKYEFVVPNSKLKLNTQSNHYEYVQTQIDPYKSQIGENNE